MKMETWYDVHDNTGKYVNTFTDKNSAISYCRYMGHEFKIKEIKVIVK